MTKTQKIVQKLCHEADLRAVRACMDEDCDQATVTWLRERADALYEASKALDKIGRLKTLCGTYGERRSWDPDSEKVFIEDVSECLTSP